MTPPPGLQVPGKQKTLKNKQNPKWKSMETLAMQHWDSLPQTFQGALQEMGIHKKAEPEAKNLEEIVLQHLNSLPDPLKSQLEGVLKPKEEENEKTTAQKLKTNVGQIRDLTHRREAAQQKVDLLKDQYRAALGDLQELQNQLDKAQETLKASAEQYGKMMLARKIEEEPSATQIEEEVMWQMLQKAGLQITEEQKENIQKMMTENHTKRKKTEGPADQKKCG